MYNFYYKGSLSLMHTCTQPAFHCKLLLGSFTFEIVTF